MRLVGDASSRSYYRVRLEKGSLIVALMPEAFDPDSFPFLNVARLFDRIPVRIPKIHDVAGSEGILLLEDLGDDLLQSRATGAQATEKTCLYRRAVSILNRIQSRGAELRDERFIPYRLAFDKKKLLEELVFFEQHFMMGFCGFELSDDDRETLHVSFETIASELDVRPRVLCHRDYHSRNLMVIEDELAVIDFQDARMGPVSYDLVSLLRDSYVEHEAHFVAEMLEEFRRGGGGADFEDEFDIMALQRNLKALGTFGYQISVRGNDVYRPYVAATLHLVRRNLDENSRWDGLRKTLASHLPEIA